MHSARSTLKVRFVGLVLFLALALGPAWAQAAEESTDRRELKPNVLRWSTQSERENFGYDVFRATAKDGPFERINERVIPGAGTTDIPQRYRYEDKDLQAGMTYWYYIESISYNGKRRRVTPTSSARARYRSEDG